MELGLIEPSSYIPEVDLFEVRTKSCSRKNCAANLVRSVFTPDEMRSSNVRGVLGKQKLDKGKIAWTKSNVFRLYPLLETETEKTAWAGCIRSIDEACRRLNRK